MEESDFVGDESKRRRTRRPSKPRPSTRERNSNNKKRQKRSKKINAREAGSGYTGVERKIPRRGGPVNPSCYTQECNASDQVLTPLKRRDRETTRQLGL
jgi:hypothetical protein